MAECKEMARVLHEGNEKDRVSGADLGHEGVAGTSELGKEPARTQTIEELVAGLQHIAIVDEILEIETTDIYQGISEAVQKLGLMARLVASSLPTAQTDVSLVDREIKRQVLVLNL